MTDASHSAEYPVYFSQSGTGFRLRLYDRGITLDQDGFAFTTEQGRTHIPYSRIRGIRLQSAFAQKGETAAGICTIKYGNHRKVFVHSTDSWSRADDAQLRYYVAFLRDFHRRIPPDARRHIAFMGGLGETRFMFLSATLIVGAALFGVLPLVMLMLKPGFETLGLAVAGGGLCYGGWRLWTKNRPGPYSPDSIPDRLLP